MTQKKVKGKKTASKNNGAHHHMEHPAPEGQPIAGVPGVSAPGFLVHLGHGPSVYDVRQRALELACSAHANCKIEDKQGCITTNEEIVATSDAFYAFLTKPAAQSEDTPSAPSADPSQPTLA